MGRISAGLPGQHTGMKAHYEFIRGNADAVSGREYREREGSSKALRRAYKRGWDLGVKSKANPAMRTRSHPLSDAERRRRSREVKDVIAGRLSVGGRGGGAYSRHRIASQKEYDPRSFRTKHIGKRHAIVVGCPKGHYHPSSETCDASMEVQSVLTRGNPMRPMKAIFRTGIDGNVVVLFPRSPSAYGSDYCLAYTHVGGHFAADYNLTMKQTRMSTPGEIKPMYRELKARGYTLETVLRATEADHAERRKLAQWSEDTMRNPAKLAKWERFKKSVGQNPLDPLFQKRVQAVASANGLTWDQVYEMWKKYTSECTNYDQSPIWEEFLGWNKDKLPKIPRGMYRLNTRNPQDFSGKTRFPPVRIRTEKKPAGAFKYAIRRRGDESKPFKEMRFWGLIPASNRAGWTHAQFAFGYRTFRDARAATYSTGSGGSIVDLRIAAPEVGDQSNPSKPACECADPGCPKHKGQSFCPEPATTVLLRSDMTDIGGTAMCVECAEDALGSGVFYEPHRGKVGHLMAIRKNPPRDWHEHVHAGLKEKLENIDFLIQQARNAKNRVTLERLSNERKILIGRGMEEEDALLEERKAHMNPDTRYRQYERTKRGKARFPSWCRLCIYKERPHMMTGYSIPDSKCDLCGHVADLAIVDPSKKYPKSWSRASKKNPGAAWHQARMGELEKEAALDRIAMQKAKARGDLVGVRSMSESIAYREAQADEERIAYMSSPRGIEKNPDANWHLKRMQSLERQAGLERVSLAKAKRRGDRGLMAHLSKNINDLEQRAYEERVAHAASPGRSEEVEMSPEELSRFVNRRRRARRNPFLLTVPTLAGLANPRRTKSNPSLDTSDPVVQKAISQHRRFHGSNPTGYYVVQILDGQKGVRRVVGFEMGDELAKSYQTKNRKSNKYGDRYVHPHRNKGNMPKLVCLTDGKTMLTVCGSKGRKVTDWIRGG